MRSAQLLRNDNTIRLLRPFWDTSWSQKFGRSSLTKKKQEESDPYEGNYSFAECDQFTKVTLIGAAGRVGKTLSLLLKTCPLIDHLCLFDTEKSVKGVGIDVSHIDTRCCVSYVCGMRNIQQALNAPDVVIIAAGCPASPNLNGKKLFEKNAPIVAGLSEACARFCPKACIVLITSPINSLLPVMGEVYQIITNKIPSRKMFGLTTLDVVRANTFVAEVVRRDPNSIIVPVIGGTSQETLVPVISQMKPCCQIKRGEMIALTECLKRAEENLTDCQNCGTRGASTLSTAYAGFRFITSLVMALKGAENIIECAFVKSDIIPELEYLASPLRLGIRGIEYNFGYPPLSDGGKQLEELFEEKQSNEGIQNTIHEFKASQQLSCYLKPSLLQKFCKSVHPVRNFHTMWKDKISYDEKGIRRKLKTDEYKRYLMEDRLKMLVPMKRVKLPTDPDMKPKIKSNNVGLREMCRNLKLPTNQYKSLNAAAKQKLRNFNMQKRFTPSASALILLDLRKRKAACKNLGIVTTVPIKKYDIFNEKRKLENKISKEEDAGEEESEKDEGGKNLPKVESNHELAVRAEKDEIAKYKDFIFEQLRQLKKENEELKKRVMQLSLDKNKSIENDIQAQSENIELEKTKLKACWVIMSSTMDAFSNFCKKFTTKSDDQLLDAAGESEKRRQKELEEDGTEEDEFEDALETQEKSEEKKQFGYDDKYFRFLEKLMEDQMENRMEEEKKRSRMKK